MVKEIHEEKRAEPEPEPRYAVLFPGQGVQRAGMGRPWRETASWELVETVSRASGHDVAELLLTADEETLTRTDLAQIAVFTGSLLAWSDFRRREPEARVVALAGHSLGEFTALVAAGVLSVADGAWLVGERGRAMAEAAARHPGAMAAVLGEGAERVAELVAELRESGEDLWVANHNGPQQTVVAGSRSAVDALAAAAPALDLRCRVLAVGAACHSPYMKGAEAALRRALELTGFRASALPVVANVDARPHEGGRRWRELAARQLTGPVRWSETLSTLHEELGCTAFLDIGPGRTLAGLARRALPGVPARYATAPSPAPAAAAA
ncbi:acyltransferase domain-containing protein [Streptomyces sp. 3MP-14]|uniref:Malonyl CoA-acyl carrier protein transacylase n=1 Tax=Streptomyces mimosae TaxID=2586635 RepID=A0A5N6A0J8_9ACTN|nr:MULTISPECIES: ACP S-malonyltransferase [Streptomyces]KAB8162287.1 acyltransferase domain-containing protein [Streptomyces mimosae]KAB8173814.1 acyltransferase domain-containing protein [Streptomyces sp. 3MP-14]